MRRSFPPGSEWLYAKLYTGTATADGLLREVVAPVVREALGCRRRRRWFFIRYGDPDWHLRVRFHGDPRGAPRAESLPRLDAAARPAARRRPDLALQLDTYEREVERYGGPEGIALAERLFQADSEAVLAILEMLEGDEGADVRWRLALRGIDLPARRPRLRRRGEGAPCCERHARLLLPRVRRRQGPARAARPAAPRRNGGA